MPWNDRTGKLWRVLPHDGPRPGYRLGLAAQLVQTRLGVLLQRCLARRQQPHFSYEVGVLFDGSLP